MKPELALYVVAAGQLGIAILNLFLVRLLDWRAELERMPLLVREVFTVHAWFISVTLAIFGAVTFRFAPEFAAASHEVFRWLAAGIGERYGLHTTLSAVRNIRGVRKANMVHNGYTPKMEIDAQTYAVRADGQLLTCEPATLLPMAQRYFLF